MNYSCIKANRGENKVYLVSDHGVLVFGPDFKLRKKGLSQKVTKDLLIT